MKRPAKKFALGTLAVSVIWILLEHVLGFNTTRHDLGEMTRMFPMLFFWMMIFVNIYYKRKGHGNTLTFAEGFKSGASMTLLFCAGFTIVIILYQQFLNPDYYTTLLAYKEGQWQAKGLAAEEIDRHRRQLQMEAGGSTLSYLLLFVFAAVWGMVISAIASLILRRKPRHSA